MTLDHCVKKCMAEYFYIANQIIVAAFGYHEHFWLVMFLAVYKGYLSSVTSVFY